MSAMSDGLLDDAGQSGLIEKFRFGKSAFCSSSTIRCLVNVLAWEMTDNDSNSSVAKRECLIILSLPFGLKRGRIDQENNRVLLSKLSVRN